MPPPATLGTRISNRGDRLETKSLQTVRNGPTTNASKIDEGDDANKTRCAPATEAAGPHPAGADRSEWLQECNRQLHRLAEESNSAAALSVFNQMRGQGVVPDVVTFNRLFRACKKSRSVDVRLLESLLSCMASCQVVPNLDTYHEVLSCYGRGGNWAQAEQLLQDMRRRGVAPDVKMYCSMVTGYGRSNQIRKAQMLFQEMKDSGIQPDVGVYNALIMACCRCRSWRAAVQAYETLELALNVKPDIISYNQAILAYGRLGQWQNALSVFQDMKAQNVHPNEVTYNNLINACGRKREWHVAAGIFGQMKRRGVQPTVVTYNTLITAYADSGQLQKCLPVLRKMMNDGVCQPNTVTFNALLTAFSQDSYDSQAFRQGALQELVEVWRRLLESRSQPNCLTYDAFVGACEAAGQRWEDVAEVLEEMLRTQSHWPEPQMEILSNLLLCIYERARMCRQAHSLYAQMEEKGYQPVLVTYNALLGLCEYERKWELALSIHSDMQSNRCEPDGVTYSALISTFEECGEWERATDWLELAIKKGYFDCVKGHDIDLHHVRSAGTAQTILRWYLRQLRTKALVDRQNLPSNLKVITGWGRHSAVTGYSPVKERVVTLLEQLRSPFRIPVDNPGCLEAPGELVIKWLVTDEIVSLLRFISGNHTSWRRNFSPRDQPK
eukprot:CAMPEP_0114238980 /NCGR_PEP_ID=MMETSP0058-20121206/8208_1 /TAXON_ID=36894 /ORGANISM="Pyramimonas parkeae, CCMP726" /LENGTH=667 /DNA_ID=CAMNT_0001351115 /DNA_START=622 /DNA_END=2625 /DNA_ORIENTATION=+